MLFGTFKVHNHVKLLFSKVVFRRCNIESNYGLDRRNLHRYFAPRHVDADQSNSFSGSHVLYFTSLARSPVCYQAGPYFRVFHRQIILSKMPVRGGVAGGGIGGFNGGANFAFGGARVFDGRASDGEPTCIEAVCRLITCTAWFLIIGSIFAGIVLWTTTGAVVPDFFSPGETRLVSFGSFFCDEVTLVSKSSTGATLYLITDTPPLTDRNDFTINSSLTLSDNFFKCWYYYLYPGSTFSTSFRTRSNSDSGTVFLFKGKNSIQRWLRNSFLNRPVAALIIPCSSQHHFSLSVQEEDEYYFVYYNNRGRQCPQSSSQLQLDVTISVSRLQYSTEDLATATNCSVIEGECSLNVPAHPNYRALIVTDIPDDPDWEENVDVTLHCSSNREWAYAVVVLIPLLVIVGVSITAVILGCVCKRSCRRQSSQSSQSETAVSSALRIEVTPRDYPKTARPADESNGQELTTVPPPSYELSFAYPNKNETLPPPVYYNN